MFSIHWRNILSLFSIPNTGLSFPMKGIIFRWAKIAVTFGSHPSLHLRGIQHIWSFLLPGNMCPFVLSDSTFSWFLFSLLCCSNSGCFFWLFLLFYPLLSVHCPRIKKRSLDLFFFYPKSLYKFIQFYDCIYTLLTLKFSLQPWSLPWVPVSYIKLPLWHLWLYVNWDLIFDIFKTYLISSILLTF